MKITTTLTYYLKNVPIDWVKNFHKNVFDGIKKY